MCNLPALDGTINGILNLLDMLLKVENAKGKRAANKACLTMTRSGEVMTDATGFGCSRRRSSLLFLTKNHRRPSTCRG